MSKDSKKDMPEILIVDSSVERMTQLKELLSPFYEVVEASPAEDY